MSEAVSCLTSRVFLIRHGETVDNIKGLYAGSRDSALTSHGVQQTIRLGRYFANQGITFSHMFSSDLSRALRTAENVLAYQKGSDQVSIVQNRALREQDFGDLEGQPYNDRTSDPIKSRKVINQEDHAAESGLKNPESKDAMRERAQQFLGQHLFPTVGSTSAEHPRVVAVVSHGNLLAALWRCMLSAQAQDSVRLAPEVTAQGPHASLEHLGGWSNTGYLELAYDIDPPGSSTLPSENEAAICTMTWKLRILTINGRSHLSSLKRTRSGLGSSQHDENQKSIDSFFKKAKTG